MLDKIEVIPAVKDNEEHRKGTWIVKKENILFSRRTTDEITYEDHCIWWENNFDKQYFYIVLHQSETIGYIRIPKKHPSIKDENEISIALKKEYRDKGIGSQAYELFENQIKSFDLSHIVAHTHVSNKNAQKFFEMNGYRRVEITVDYIKYVKNL